MFAFRDRFAIAFYPARFGFNPSESFVVPADVRTFYKKLQEDGAKREEEYNALFATYEVM